MEEETFWERYRSWPTVLQVGFAVVAWPFVVAGWLWDRPGRDLPGHWTLPRVGSVAVGAVVGFPWMLLVAALLVQVVPAGGFDRGDGSDGGGDGSDSGVLDVLDPPTIDSPPPPTPRPSP